MKIIFILFFPFLLFAQDINEFQIDIYFGNGVGNTLKEATNSKTKLKDFIEDNNITSKHNLKFNYFVAYNWTGETDGGTKADKDVAYDMIETFYLIKESGQDSLSDFGTYGNEIVNSCLSFFKKAVYVYKGIDRNKKDYEKYKRILKEYPNLDINDLSSLLTVTTVGNMKRMIAKYKKESLDKFHKVIGIAHSEGNLFMNRVLNPTYGLSAIESRNFKMIGVGVAADNVQGVYEGNIPGPTYVTLSEDWVIGSVGNSLPSNVESIKGEGSDIFGHNFIGEYLSQTNSKARLKKLIKNAVSKFDNEPSAFKTNLSPCSNTGIIAVDKNNSNIKITVDIVKDANGLIYDINGTVVQSLTYDTNISDFHVKKSKIGYLTFIHESDYDLLRKSVAMPSYQEIHNENKLYLTPKNEIDSQYGILTDETYSKLYYSSGTTLDPRYYLNNSTISLSAKNSNLYANETLIPLKYYEGFNGTQNLFSNILVEKVEKIYTENNVEEFRVNYCKK